MATNKVVINGVTKIDLTGDTITAQTLLKNETAHNAAGEAIVGTLEGPPTFASNVSYDNTGTGLSGDNVQTAIDELAENVLYDNNGTGLSATNVQDALDELAEYVIEKKNVIYGFHINPNESDPTAAVTYLEDAIDMTPAYMDFTTGVFNYGSWANAFFMPRPCMLNFNGTVDYYLDQNDYTKKATGEASDVSDLTYNGNAMMEWGRDGKKIWLKCVPDTDPTGASIYIASYQADQDYHAWSFINNQGDLVDHFYTPIYNGHLDSSNRMRSMSRQQCSAGYTAEQERTYCRNNNTNLAIWDTEVYCDVMLMNYLMTLISKSLDSQAKFGQGITTNGTQSTNNGFRTGVHDDKGLFFGTSSGAAGTYSNAVKIFGMENWWGFALRRFCGYVNANGTLKYKLTRGTADGSAVSDYVVSSTAADYAGYLTGSVLPPSSGSYISRQTYQTDGSYTPTVVNGSSSLFYCDILWTNNGQVNYINRGGNSNAGVQCGTWNMILNHGAGDVEWFRTATPSCKPLS